MEPRRGERGVVALVLGVVGVVFLREMREKGFEDSWKTGHDLVFYIVLFFSHNKIIMVGWLGSV